MAAREVPCPLCIESGGGVVALWMIGGEAHAAFLRCDDASPGPRNNEFNVSSRSSASTGDALCAISGTTLSCDFSACDAGSDENALTMIVNEDYIAESWVVQVECDVGGTRRTLCQIYQDAATPVVETVVVTGTAESDWIGFEDSVSGEVMASYSSSGGPDLMVEAYGEAAHDILVGSTTQLNYTEKLHGGSGHDHLIAQAGPDELYGDAGSDVLIGGNDPDKLWGGSELDWLIGGLALDELRGEAGNDTLCANGEVGMKANLQSKFAAVFTGSETVNWTTWSGAQECAAVPTYTGTSSEFELLDGGAGNDILVAGEYFVKMKGGSGDDEGTGSGGPDLICDANNETDYFRSGGDANEFYIMSNTAGPGTWDASGGTATCRTRGGTDITVVNCTATTDFTACPF